MLLLVFMFGIRWGMRPVLIDIQRFIYVLYRGWVRWYPVRQDKHQQINFHSQ